MSEAGAPYPEPRARAWLAWLARRMKRERQTVFLIEGMQPDWLATRAQRVLYRAGFAVVMGLLLGLTLAQAQLMGNQLDPGADPGTSWWLICLATATWVFAVGGVDTLGIPGLAPAPGDGRWGLVAKWIARLLTFFGVWVVLWLALQWGAGRLFDDTVRLDYPLLLGGLLAPIYVARVSASGRTRTVEALSWTWRRAGWGLLLGLFAGVFMWLVYRQARTGTFPLCRPGQAYTEREIAQNLFLYPPLAAAFGFLVGGLSMQVVQEKTEPNEGIRLSLRNALRGALICGPILGLVCYPVLVMTLGEPTLPGALSGWVLSPACTEPLVAGSGDHWFGTLSFGGIVAAIAFLWFGGVDLIGHGVLRLILGATRQLPFDLVRFLEYAADELQFLQKAGGGYMFIHRHLLDYFAARDR